jgi:formate hydrogenlyase subunit 4
MVEAAAALKLMLYFSLLICMFFPFGMATHDKTVAAMAFGIALYVAKLSVLAMLLPIGETAVAKMRVFRYPVFLGGAFATAALAVFLLFVSQGF